MASDYQLFVGIDIAAQTATAAWTRLDRQVSQVVTIAQSAEGYQELNTLLLATGTVACEILVVMEATGTYWMQLAWALHQQGFAVSVINPMQAHHFAAALLKRAKTDAIDAQTLAQLALLLQPSPWTAPPAVYEELYQRLTERDALMQMQRQERNRLHALHKRFVLIPSVQQRIQQHLDLLQRQITSIERELEHVFCQDAEWAAAAERLRSVPGLGAVTVGWLLVSTLNFSLGHTPDQLASFAGLAPHPQQSGTSLHTHGQVAQGGHARLRTALYMAALTAIRLNPVLAAFYRRLRERGKPAKVALCAVARKLLHLAWALVTKHQMFDPHHESCAVA